VWIPRVGSDRVLSLGRQGRLPFHDSVVAVGVDVVFVHAVRAVIFRCCCINVCIVQAELGVSGRGRENAEAVGRKGAPLRVVAVSLHVVRPSHQLGWISRCGSLHFE
jgi:hypothetical protein